MRQWDYGKGTEAKKKFLEVIPPKHLNLLKSLSLLNSYKLYSSRLVMWHL